MNRHLHNTLSALVASGSLLVVGLIAAAPLMPQHPGEVQPVASTIEIHRLEAVAAAAALTADVATAQVLATAFEQAQPIDTDSQRKTRTSPRARRQTLVMPYLSFVPRG